MGADSKERILWPDVARGVAVVLVVFNHVVVKYLAESQTPVGGLAILESIVQALSPLRMPLFFAISGMFAVSALNGSWRGLLNRKVAFFYYLYVAWLIVHTVVFLLLDSTFTEVSHSPLEFLAKLSFDPSTLWYLWALAVYFVLAKLLWAWTPVLIGVGVVLSLIGQAGGLSFLGNVAPTMTNFLWFALGAVLSIALRNIHITFQWWWVPCATVAYVAGCALVFIADDSWRTFAYMIASAIGGSAGVVLSIAVARWFGQVAALLAWVGTRTLQIYTVHFLVLGIWIWGVAAVVAPFLSGLVATAAYAVLLTVAISAVCVVLPFDRYARWLIRAPWGTPSASARNDEASVSARGL